MAVMVVMWVITMENTTMENTTMENTTMDPTKDTTMKCWKRWTRPRHFSRGKGSGRRGVEGLSVIGRGMTSTMIINIYMMGMSIFIMMRKKLV